MRAVIGKWRCNKDDDSPAERRSSYRSGGVRRRQSAAAVAVTGCPGERGSRRPVAETRDVQIHLPAQAGARRRPDQFPRRYHQQDHRRAARVPRPVGAAMGHGGHEGIARSAEERLDQSHLLRPQGFRPVGRITVRLGWPLNVIVHKDLVLRPYHGTNPN
jgi:hypothetical protein